MVYILYRLNQLPDYKYTKTLTLEHHEEQCLCLLHPFCSQPPPSPSPSPSPIFTRKSSSQPLLWFFKNSTPLMNKRGFTVCCSSSCPPGIHLFKVNNRNTDIVLVSLLLTLNLFHTLF